MPPTPTPILLLRAPDPTPETDKYTTAFRNASYDPICIPVLETVFVNEDVLRGIMIARNEEEGKGYEGVLMTSKRACEAWGRVVRLVESEGKEVGERWDEIPFYVVGNTTRDALAGLREEYPHSRYLPTQENVLGAEETGNAEALGKFVLQKLSGKTGKKKLLYLTGDKNLDTLPRILSTPEIELVEVKVYETHESTTRFRSLLEGVMQTRVSTTSRSEETSETMWWIVFFAPSSTRFVWPILCEWFDLPHPQRIPTDTRVRTRTRIACIGPTTEKFLREEMGVGVDVVASKPSAEALVRAVSGFEKSSV